MLPAEGRVAIYAAPRAEDPLWRFGSRTLGYDAATGAPEPTRPPLPLAQERWEELTEEPRRYGFHATLKAPFRLAEKASFAQLSDALKTYSARHAPVPAFRLEVRAIGEFLALMPEAAPDALAALAADVVIAFDAFRAELTQGERERRLSAKLDARQVEYLERFGYPYVLEEFRFHMSLTGKVKDKVLREELRFAFAEELRREMGDAPFRLDALVLFVQAAPGRRFAIRERHALGVAPSGSSAP
jgi:putative phosphonate metabolism protein